MPEAPVAHDADSALAHVGGDRGRAREPEPVAEHGVADVERRQGREGVAADVGAHVHLAHLALHDLERAEHRALRAAGAEAGRTPGDRGGEDLRRAPFGLVDRPDDPGVGRLVVPERLAEERVDAAEHDLAGVLAGHREWPLPE